MGPVVMAASKVPLSCGSGGRGHTTRHQRIPLGPAKTIPGFRRSSVCPVTNLWFLVARCGSPWLWRWGTLWRAEIQSQYLPPPSSDSVLMSLVKQWQPHTCRDPHGCSSHSRGLGTQLSLWGPIVVASPSFQLCCSVAVSEVPGCGH